MCDQRVLRQLSLPRLTTRRFARPGGASLSKRCTAGQGRRKTSWPPMRRHRTAAAPSIVTHSNVARPSGPANDHVISQTPGAPWTGLTRNDAGHGRPGWLACSSAAAWNLTTASLKSARSASVSRRQSALKLSVRSNFNQRRARRESHRGRSQQKCGPRPRRRRPRALVLATVQSRTTPGWQVLTRRDAVR